MQVKPVPSTSAFPNRPGRRSRDLNRTSGAFRDAMQRDFFGVLPAHLAAESLNRGNYRGAQAEVAAQLLAGQPGDSTWLERQAGRDRYAAADEEERSHTVSLSA